MEIECGLSLKGTKMSFRIKHSLIILSVLLLTISMWSAVILKQQEFSNPLMKMRFRSSTLSAVL
jgi:hypothetical protein